MKTNHAIDKGDGRLGLGTERRNCRAVLNDLRAEALSQRNLALLELHRIYDRMFAGIQLRANEAIGLEYSNPGLDEAMTGAWPEGQDWLGGRGSTDFLPIKADSLASLELKTILDVMLEKIHLFVPYHSAYVLWKTDAGAAPMERLAARVRDQRAGKNRTAETGEPSHTDAGDSKSGPLSDKALYHSGFAVLENGKIIGGLSLFFPFPEPLEPRQSEFLKTLAGQVGEVIKRSISYEALLRQMALTEPEVRQDSGPMGEFHKPPTGEPPRKIARRGRGKAIAAAAPQQKRAVSGTA